MWHWILTYLIKPYRSDVVITHSNFGYVDNFYKCPLTGKTFQKSIRYEW